MNASNIKDTLSTICGILFAIATGIVTTSMGGVAIPSWLTAAAGVTVAITGAIIGFLTGKAPSAAKKTESQIVEQNEPRP